MNLIPASWGSVQDWMRIVANALNSRINGYPFPAFDSDPASVEEGFTYFNTGTKKVRTFDGTVFNDLF